MELGISVEASGEPLDEREVRMIRAVVQLDKTTAREIMVPRVDVVAAELGTSSDEMAAQMVESGHSRIPIYQDTLDHVPGYRVRQGRSEQPQPRKRRAEGDHGGRDQARAVHT